MQKEENKIQFTTEKKRLLVRVVFLLFFLGVFSVLPIFGGNVAHAGAWDTAVGWFGDAASWVADNTVVAAFKYLLYSILWLVSWFTAVAVALFAYAVDPQWISGPSGMLNLQPVYDMWKFVRDIINIAFILGLLFIAFAFIFQIDSYGNSKQVIKLIIAALLVNFSFPVARIIIDLANVPMYFFLQMILGDGNNASAALGSALGTSQLIDVLVPGSATEADVSTLLAGIIFLFLFTITILVLAMQLVIRMIALVILVILSPIGFVASGIPGMKKYGGQWWDNFLNYTFFGPAAIFMLLLATNFFAAISAADHYGSLKGVASTTSASNEGFIASMAMFFIPITMLWFAMGISKKFSIAGAEVATKYGKDFAKWTKGKVTAPVVSPVKATKKGVTKGLYKGKLFGVDYGSTKYGKLATGRYWDAGKTGAAITGFVQGRTKGAKNEMDKVRRKEVEAKIKENKESSMSWSEMTKDMKSTDQITRQAAAVLLAESGGLQSTDNLYKALDALKDNKGKIDEDLATRVLNKATGDAFDDLSDNTTVLGQDQNGGSITFQSKYNAIANDKSMYLTDDEGNYIDKKGARVGEDEREVRAGSLLDTLRSKAKSEGEIMVRANFEMDKAVEKARKKAASENIVFTAEMEEGERFKALESRIKDLNADALAKQGSIFATLSKDGPDSERLIKVLQKKASEDPGFFAESMKKMKQKSREALYDKEVVSRPSQPKEPTPEEAKAKEGVQSRRKSKEERDARAAVGRENKARPQ